MHPELEAVIAADEECRSRLTHAESRRERELAAARSRRDATIDKRRTAALESLQAEIAAIRAEGDARLAEMRNQQTTYLASLSKTGEEKFEDAVRAWLAIVCGSEKR